MFNTGLRASNRYILDEDPGYICPICLDVVRNPNKLSREHVPPRTIGGKVLCLLCKTCNSSAGQSVDAAMAERVAAKKVLLQGTKNKFLALNLSGLSVKSELFVAGDHGEFAVSKKHNNPKILKEFHNRVRNPAPGFKLHVVYPHQFNEHYAMVGYLKAAYLYAFAKFGYGYILRECMDLVRIQIQVPNKKCIWKWWLARNEETDQDMIYLCKKPINCLAVGMFEHVIVLPGFNDPLDPYEDIRTLIQGTKPEHLVGRVEGASCPTPTKMELLCDTE